MAPLKRAALQPTGTSRWRSGFSRTRSAHAVSRQGCRTRPLTSARRGTTWPRRCLDGRCRGRAHGTPRAKRRPAGPPGHDGAREIAARGAATRIDAQIGVLVSGMFSGRRSTRRGHRVALVDHIRALGHWSWGDPAASAVSVWTPAAVARIEVVEAIAGRSLGSSPNPLLGRTGRRQLMIQGHSRRSETRPAPRP